MALLLTKLSPEAFRTSPDHSQASGRTKVRHVFAELVEH